MPDAPPRPPGGLVGGLGSVGVSEREDKQANGRFSVLVIYFYLAKSRAFPDPCMHIPDRLGKAHF